MIPGNQVGLVPERAQVGDSLAIIDGAPAPFVLRDTSGSAAGNGERYRLADDAYVLGVMRGELVEEDGFERNQITLV